MLEKEDFDVVIWVCRRNAEVVTISADLYVFLSFFSMPHFSEIGTRQLLLLLSLLLLLLLLLLSLFSCTFFHYYISYSCT